MTRIECPVCKAHTTKRQWSRSTTLKNIVDEFFKIVKLATEREQQINPLYGPPTPTRTTNTAPPTDAITEQPVGKQLTYEELNAMYPDPEKENNDPKAQNLLSPDVNKAPSADSKKLELTAKINRKRKRISDIDSLLQDIGMIANFKSIYYYRQEWHCAGHR